MCVINDNTIEKWWQEPGINNEGTDDDPYIESTPDNMIKYLNTTTNAEMNTMVGIDVSANDNHSV